MGWCVTLPITTHNFTIQEYTMRTLQRLFTASVLVAVFTFSAFGGEISTTIVTPSTPPQGVMPTPDNGEISTGVNGDMHTGDTGEVAAGDAVVAGALSLLQGVLSLL
jgi:hypothetical protein